LKKSKNKTLVKSRSRSNTVETQEIEVLPKEGMNSHEIESSDEDIDEIEVLPPESEDLEEFDNIEDQEISPKESTALSKLDPLSSYLREINRYPHLTAEEEKSLAIAVKENQDRSAAYKLITSNLWLVVKIARDYEKAARNVLDLIQEGNIGLMEAVKNFDPYRGVRLPSYAVWWIKAYIIRYVIANWRLVKIGTTQAQRKLFFNLNKEKEKLEREGFYPAPKLLAERLDVKESDIIEMEQRLSGGDLSVDAPTSNGDGDSESNMLQILPDNTDSAEELLSKKERQELLNESIEEFSKTLNEKESAILKERLLGEDKVTLQDLSDKLSLSKERVRQLENRVKEKLKVFLQNKLGDNVNNLL